MNFKRYMKVQIRYIKFLCYILNLNELQIIEKYAMRFRDLYFKKHEEIRTIL
jgi:hypothetical protein